MIHDERWDRVVQSAYKLGGFFRMQMIYTEDGEHAPMVAVEGSGGDILEGLATLIHVFAEDVGLDPSAVIMMVMRKYSQIYANGNFVSIDFSKMVTDMGGGGGHG